MSFRIGQKVVCVNGKNTDHSGMVELIEGRIYTIRWCGMFCWMGQDHLCVRLEEIVSRPGAISPDQTNMPFYALRFRPVVERKTDISIFTKLLTPKRVTEPA